MAPRLRKTRSGSRSRRLEVRKTERSARETGSDTIAVVVSTLCHALILIIGALLYVGGGPDAPTAINTGWAEKAIDAMATIEQVELIERSSTGGVGSPNPVVSALVTQTGVSGASTDAGLDVQVGGGLGGAFFGSGRTGAGAHGKRIVYIVDASGSMDFRLLRQSRFQRVQRELETSILSLHKSQKYAVILFNLQSRSIGTRILRDATEKNKTRTIAKIWDSGAGGGTDPRSAISRALRLKPDTIYFLTDGVFPPSSAAALMKRQPGLTVHTFTLGDSSGEIIMQRLARANGGTYRFIDGREPPTNEATAASQPDKRAINTP